MQNIKRLDSKKRRIKYSSCFVSYEFLILSRKHNNLKQKKWWNGVFLFSGSQTKASVAAQLTK